MQILFINYSRYSNKLNFDHSNCYSEQSIIEMQKTFSENGIKIIRDRYED